MTSSKINSRITRHVQTHQDGTAPTRSTTTQGIANRTPGSRARPLSETAIAEPRSNNNGPKLFVLCFFVFPRVGLCKSATNPRGLRSCRTLTGVFLPSDVWRFVIFHVRITGDCATRRHLLRCGQ